MEKAIEGLWEYDDRSVLPGLIQVLSSEQGPAARAAAAAALGKFAALAQEGGLLSRDAQCVREQLTAILENAAENPEVRRRSLEAVAPFNTPGHPRLPVPRLRKRRPETEIQFHLRNGAHRGKRAGCLC